MKSLRILFVFCFLFLFLGFSMRTLPNKEFKVAITSVPDEAEVQLNGFYVGKTPFNLIINTNSSNFIYVVKVGFNGQRISLDGKKSEINVQLVKQ